MVDRLIAAIGEDPIFAALGFAGVVCAAVAVVQEIVRLRRRSRNKPVDPPHHATRMRAAAFHMIAAEPRRRIGK